MGLKGLLARPFAAIIAARVERDARQAIQLQEAIMQQLVQSAQNTAFGKDHGFATIRSHADFISQVPIRDYEALRPYIDRMVKGEEHVLWPGKPLYLAKTSGTTSGVKYIPLTKE
ncbi:MAG TPA: GH3 auxin-responsive promoter family protein, partial [Chitinophagales bacterium]|nr:GH3 auxin-responsive promoter family protein [Chitinophagales bacterium]